VLEGLFDTPRRPSAFIPKLRGDQRSGRSIDRVRATSGGRKRPKELILISQIHTTN